MHCHFCKSEVNENDLFCPACKKVLKLECHGCGAITKNSVCEKCGTVILNKCYKCGKLNNTAISNCPKCGMDINASIALRESLIEEFAVLTIEFKNFDEIKNALRSDKLTQTFKNKLYEIIKKNAFQKKLRVQLVDNIYIIRFCKEQTYVESCKSALDFSVLIAQILIDLNKKLFDTKGVELKTQMAVLKRDVYAQKEDYKSGLNINTVYSSSDSMRKFNNTEIAVDSFVYQVTKDVYPFQSLSSVYVKNRMVMFFELMIGQLISQEKDSTNEAELINLPEYVDFVPKEDYLNQQLIEYIALHCSFIYSQQTKIVNDLKDIASKQPMNPIISVRSNDRLGKLYSLQTSVLQEIFADYKICRFSCSDLNKYSAYGLLKQLFLVYNNCTEAELFTDSMFLDTLSTNEKLKNLLMMDVQSSEYPEDFRYFYFEFFTKFVATIPNKTLFIIDDIQNADEVSIEIIKYIYENQKMNNIGLLVSSNTEFALHRKICHLLTYPSYFDIEIKPSANKKIVEYFKDGIKNIKKSFFFEKVLENTQGSLFYFQQAMSYLVDAGVFTFEKSCYHLSNEKMVVLPTEIDELIQKRIKQLKLHTNLFEFFGYLLLLGESFPVSVVANMGIKNVSKLINQLVKQGFLLVIDDKELFINNYLIYKKNFLATVNDEELSAIAGGLLNTIYKNTCCSGVQIACTLEYAGLKKEAFAHWHKLAMVSSRLGAFAEYLNCTNKFISLVDNVIDETTDKTVEQVKLEVYDELASVMYKYYPLKVINYLQFVLTECEHNQDIVKIKEISNKLVQCCLMSGYYKNALEYIGKIISHSSNLSYNPKDKNFDLSYFFLNLVIIEIYFNLGRLPECIEVGKELLFNIDIDDFKNNILSEKFSKQTFDESILDAVFYVAFSLILTFSPNVRQDIIQIINSPLGKYNCFNLLLLILDFIEGKDISVPLQTIEVTDKYSDVLLPLLKGFVSFINNDWDSFGNYIYFAKIKASVSNFYQANSFCELMIGLAYQKLNNTKKASQIYYNILDTADERGLKTISYICWYLIAGFEFSCNDKERAMNIINSSLLQFEQDVNCADFIVLLFKILTAEVLLASGDNFEKALICAEQAFDIALRQRQFIFINKIANILMYIYNSVLNTQSDVNIVQEFQVKIQNLNNIMTQITSA